MNNNVATYIYAESLAKYPTYHQLHTNQNMKKYLGDQSILLAEFYKAVEHTTEVEFSIGLL